VPEVFPGGPPCHDYKMGYLAEYEIYILPLLQFEVVKDDYVRNH
jgi:hypothetical protein